MNNTNQKAILRRKYKDIRNAIPEDQCIQYSKLITDYFCNVFYTLLNKNTIVFIYNSFGSEVCTDLIINNLLNKNIPTALPVCSNVDGIMDFYYINPDQQPNPVYKNNAVYKTSAYGISEPMPAPSRLAVPDADSVIVLPGLAFDRGGGRLGYGKGYYDRYLSSHSYKTTIGFAFDAQLADDESGHRLPCEPYDIKVDIIITESGVFHVQ